MDENSALPLSWLLFQLSAFLNMYLCFSQNDFGLMGGGHTLDVSHTTFLILV